MSNLALTSGQVNMKGLIRDVKKEEVTRLLKTVMENNI